MISCKRIMPLIVQALQFPQPTIEVNNPFENVISPVASVNTFFSAVTL